MPQSVTPPKPVLPRSSAIIVTDSADSLSDDELVARPQSPRARLSSSINVLQHDITVNSAKPIKQHAYCINPVKRVQMKNETDYLLEHGFARHSSSPWSSPCLLETKSDKLDLLKGYWQVPLTERACQISAFVTPDCFLEYTVMAFGMCNAPATFQRLVDTVLANLTNCNAYLDDLIYAPNWEQH